MSKALRAIAVALALTMISLAWLIEPLVQSAHIPIYHWSGRPSLLFGPVALDVAVMWVAFTLLILWAQRPGRGRVAIWAGILVCLPWLALRNVHRLAAYSIPHWYLLGIVVWTLAVLLWRPSLAKRTDWIIELTATVLAFVALSAVFFLSEFSWFWWQARGVNDPPTLHVSKPVAVATQAHPRIIWIILDELSYQQVYERRYPGLQLPAFDALASNATVFTHVVPAGKYTEQVLPALLTGVPVVNLHSSASGQMMLYDASTARWKRFDEHNTVFQDALNDGYETAVAGWYNPYCRILPAVLMRCSWSDDDTLENGLTANGTFRSNLVASTASSAMLHYLLSKALRVRSSQEEDEAELHVQDYENLYAAGDRLLLDRGMDFVFLHLPVPHPQGIYNRATGQLTGTSSTYMDNLALADKYLAHVRSILEQGGQWDSSTVIVMGDHGWRTTFLWESLPGWTKEEERASDGGKFDDRPAYIVKLAGQHGGTRIDAPFRAVKTRAMLDELIAGKIRTAEDLRVWVQRQTQEGSQGAVGNAPGLAEAAQRKSAAK